MEDETKKYIDYTIKKTIEEYLQRDLVKDGQAVAYADAARALVEHYAADDGNNQTMKAALNQIKNDKYFNILPFCYKHKKTVEEVAEIFDVDVSTITRNKRRLCLEIYKLL